MMSATISVLGQLGDLFGRLAVEKQLGAYRPRRDGVDRDAAAAQFVGEHAHQAFDAGFGRDIRPIAGK